MYSKNTIVSLMAPSWTTRYYLKELRSFEKLFTDSNVSTSLEVFGAIISKGLLLLYYRAIY